MILKDSYEYTPSGLLAVHNDYTFSLGVEYLVGTDTLEYDGNNRLIRGATYYDVATDFYPNLESLLTYVGASTELATINLSMGDGTSAPNWTYSIDYTYLTGVPTQLVAYDVVLDIIQTPASILIDYTFGGNQRLSNWSMMRDGVLERTFDYEYDGLNFVTKKTNREILKPRVARSTCRGMDVLQPYIKRSARIGSVEIKT